MFLNIHWSKYVANLIGHDLERHTCHVRKF